MKRIERKDNKTTPAQQKEWLNENTQLIFRNKLKEQRFGDCPKESKADLSLLLWALLV